MNTHQTAMDGPWDEGPHANLHRLADIEIPDIVPYPSSGVATNSIVIPVSVVSAKWIPLEIPGLDWESSAEFRLNLHVVKGGSTRLVFSMIFTRLHNSADDPLEFDYRTIRVERCLRDASDCGLTVHAVPLDSRSYRSPRVTFQPKLHKLGFRTICTTHPQRGHYLANNFRFYFDGRPVSNTFKVIARPGGNGGGKRRSVTDANKDYTRDSMISNTSLGGESMDVSMSGNEGRKVMTHHEIRLQTQAHLEYEMENIQRPDEYYTDAHLNGHTTLSLLNQHQLQKQQQTGRDSSNRVYDYDSDAPPMTYEQRRFSEQLVQHTSKIKQQKNTVLTPSSNEGSGSGGGGRTSAEEDVLARASMGLMEPIQEQDDAAMLYSMLDNLPDTPPIHAQPPHRKTFPNIHVGGQGKLTQTRTGDIRQLQIATQSTPNAYDLDMQGAHTHQRGDNISGVHSMPMIGPNVTRPGVGVGLDGLGGIGLDSHSLMYTQQSGQTSAQPQVSAHPQMQQGIVKPRSQSLTGVGRRPRPLSHPTLMERLYSGNSGPATHPRTQNSIESMESYDSRYRNSTSTSNTPREGVQFGSDFPGLASPYPFVGTFFKEGTQKSPIDQALPGLIIPDSSNVAVAGSNTGSKKWYGNSTDKNAGGTMKTEGSSVSMMGGIGMGGVDVLFNDNDVAMQTRMDLDNINVDINKKGSANGRVRTDHNMHSSSMYALPMSSCTNSAATNTTTSTSRYTRTGSVDGYGNGGASIDMMSGYGKMATSASGNGGKDELQSFHHQSSRRSIGRLHSLPYSAPQISPSNAMNSTSIYNRYKHIPSFRAQTQPHTQTSYTPSPKTHTVSDNTMGTPNQNKRNSHPGSQYTSRSSYSLAKPNSYDSLLEDYSAVHMSGPVQQFVGVDAEGEDSHPRTMIYNSHSQASNSKTTTTHADARQSLESLYNRIDSNNSTGTGDGAASSKAGTSGGGGEGVSCTSLVSKSRDVDDRPTRSTSLTQDNETMEHLQSLRLDDFAASSTPVNHGSGFKQSLGKQFLTDEFCEDGYKRRKASLAVPSLNKQQTNNNGGNTSSIGEIDNMEGDRLSASHARQRRASHQDVVSSRRNSGSNDYGDGSMSDIREESSACADRSRTEFREMDDPNKKIKRAASEASGIKRKVSDGGSHAFERDKIGPGKGKGPYDESGNNSFRSYPHSLSKEGETMFRAISAPDAQSDKVVEDVETYIQMLFDKP
eukprot:CFRG5158T1